MTCAQATDEVSTHMHQHLLHVSQTVKRFFAGPAYLPAKVNSPASTKPMVIGTTAQQRTWVDLQNIAIQAQKLTAVHKFAMNRESECTSKRCSRECQEGQ
jgi:hypothetical protein